MGTYLHGLFGSDAFRAAFLARLGVRSSIADHPAHVVAALDAIAAHLEKHVDVEGLLAAAK